jgi:acyl-CoA dehydrogenase
MAIPRTIFSAEHLQFGESVDRFIEVEVQPHYERYEDQGFIDREIWLKAGAAGFLCSSMPSEYGGADADKLYSVIMFERFSFQGVHNLLGLSLHSEIVALSVALRQ